MIRTIFGILIIGWLMSNFSTGGTSTKPYDYNYYKELTYQELYDFPNTCDKAATQLEFLHRLQESKHFDSDPDNLSINDQDYNGRLKATIWWYAYRCNKS